jgi:hypothetical protein
MSSLPKVTVTAYGKTEEGPTLQSVLGLAGIEDFNTLTVKGMLRGRVATGELTLKPADVLGGAILDFSNRGTAKVAGANIPEDNWIIDVSEIWAE